MMVEPTKITDGNRTKGRTLRAMLGEFGSSTSLMMSRLMHSAFPGLQFGGARDLYAVFGYNRQPKHIDYVAKYLKQDITQRLINAPVDALWTDQPTVIGGPRFEKQWKQLCIDYDILPALARTDVFAGLGAYAILVVGIDDGQALDTPVRRIGSAVRKITYLQPYLEGSVEIVKLEESTASPRFGLPVMYRVSPSESAIKNASVLAGKSVSAFNVHHSRVLHLSDNNLENSWYGHSRLESIFNTLDDLQKVTGGAAETFWLTSNRGMQVDVDKEMELEEEDAQQLSDEIDEYQNGIRRFLRTRGVKVTNLGSDVADPRGVFFTLMSLLSANTGIPQRVLMGAEAGQLASQQDRANWSIQIGQRASKWGWPKVLKPFIGLLVEMSVIVEPKDLSVEWPEFFKMNPFERGQTSAQQARSATNVARAQETWQKIGVDGISVEEAREMVAPGKQLLVLVGTPTGTFPPKLSAPVNDPQNAIDLVEKTGEIAAEAADKAQKSAEKIAKNTPAVDPNNPTTTTTKKKGTTPNA